MVYVVSSQLGMRIGKRREEKEFSRRNEQ